MEVEHITQNGGLWTRMHRDSQTLEGEAETVGMLLKEHAQESFIRLVKSLHWTRRRKILNLIKKKSFGFSFGYGVGLVVFHDLVKQEDIFKCSIKEFFKGKLKNR